MKKYLVTGAAGFVGSSLVDKLLSLGCQVTGIDNFSTGRKEFLSNAILNPRFSFINADLLHDLDWFECFKGIDCVYHFAANADIRGGVENVRRDLEQNTIVTFNVLEAARTYNVRRFVFSSTAAALGEASVFPTPEDCPIPAQTSLYGASKMACEGLISAYSHAFDIQSYVFRFVSLLGPRYAHGHVFDFVRSLIKHPDRLEILGNGFQRKSYLHINDCIDALLHICDARPPSERYEVFHLGTNEYCEVRQSAIWIAEEMSLNPTFVYGTSTHGWVGDNPFVFLDTQKALSAGWTPRCSIEVSIRETANWLLNNRWIFQS